MSFARLVPRTLLSRSFLLIVVLLLLSLSSALAIFHHLQQEPRARQMAQLVVTMVNLTRAAMLSAAPEWRIALLTELSDIEGLGVSLAESSDRLTPVPEHSPELLLMMQKVRANLGEGTRFASQRNGVRALWVSFFIAHEEFWMEIPSERIERSFSQLLLIWTGVVLLLALCGAYLIARQVSLPLKQLARATQQLGLGIAQHALTVQGAQEIRIVTHAFNQMSADLAAHERERALVLAGVSHDLRTPLTRIRLAAELSQDETLRAGLSDDVAQMDEVIQQFLDYAKLDEAEALTQLDLSELVSSIALRYPSAAHSLSLVISPKIYADVRPQLLKRALRNLLDNAVKYGGEEIQIRLTQSTQHIILSVCDNGVGIAPAERELACRPFVRLQTARSNVGGAGLGLAIVERAARLHHGSLQLSENTPHGLCARIVLPS